LPLGLLIGKIVVSRTGGRTDMKFEFPKCVATFLAEEKEFGIAESFS